jgi:hypothetical protein
MARRADQDQAVAAEAAPPVAQSPRERCAIAGEASRGIVKHDEVVAGAVHPRESEGQGLLPVRP